MFLVVVVYENVQENISSTVLPVHEMLGESRNYPTSDTRRTQTPLVANIAIMSNALLKAFFKYKISQSVTSEFLQNKIKILFFKEGSWGWGEGRSVIHWNKTWTNITQILYGAQ